VVRSGLLKPVASAKSYRILQAVLLYGFLLGVLVIALGFGLKYRELSKSDQRRAVSLLQGEYSANAATVEALRTNTITLMTLFQNVAQLLRNPDIPALSTLFPAANLEADTKASPNELAVAALASLVDRGLDQNELELEKGDQAARAIVGMLNRTQRTVSSLSDPSHTRYTVDDRVWQGNLSILYRVRLEGIPEFQASYTAIRKVRSDYDVVCSNIAAYFEALKILFDPTTGVSLQPLTAVLAQERQSLTLILAYGETLTAEMERIKVIDAKLRNLAT
jgi:hypothetical protein